MISSFVTMLGFVAVYHFGWRQVPWQGLIKVKSLTKVKALIEVRCILRNSHTQKKAKAKQKQSKQSKAKAKQWSNTARQCEMAIDYKLNMFLHVNWSATQGCPWRAVFPEQLRRGSPSDSFLRQLSFSNECHLKQLNKRRRTILFESKCHLNQMNKRRDVLQDLRKKQPTLLFCLNCQI